MESLQIHFCFWRKFILLFSCSPFGLLMNGSPLPLLSWRHWSELISLKHRIENFSWKNRMDYKRNKKSFILLLYYIIYLLRIRNMLDIGYNVHI